MTSYFITSEGDIFPFSSVIRAIYKPNGLEHVRVYFVNGSIDLSLRVDGDFHGKYEEWLSNLK